MTYYVSSGTLNLTKPKPKPETVLSMGGQITDSIRPYALHWLLWHQNLQLPCREGGQAMGRTGLSRRRPALEETGCQAVYCKHTAPGSPNRLTCAVSTSFIQTHLAFIKGTASPLTIDCHTGLCFYDHP